MNRAERRKYMKALRKGGLSKQIAKETANRYIANYYKVGDKCRINYELCIRHPQWKLQQEDFKKWVTEHKDSILTVDAIYNKGETVTFEEDINQEKFKHQIITLIPVATATIKMEDGTEKKVVLDGVSDINDPKIMEKVNETLNKETE